MTEVIVKTDEVVKEYRMGTNVVKALSGVNLEIYQGEYLSLMGPSGSGKSTLFNMIGALDRPTTGNVFIDGQNTSSLSMSQIAWLRCHKIGYIFQSYNLLPVMTALQNVTLPMIFAGLSVKERNVKGEELLERVGLGERVHHLPDELSGGQRQRVAIARALANDPNIILADEPTANLDMTIGREIITLVKHLNTENNVTIISATHDLKMLDVSDRIVDIRDGKVERIRNRDEIQLEVGAVGH
ncbi:ABC transporter ATP-binding protein [Candidatus Poribacteria bacterium]|jgi:putative ABC transport system ATP-binding protein|nr:ABC transporter [Candidatus Poribacteria bacterium]MBP95126.1 ABC transporter [Candidatus Poribacteria bacterium]MCH2574188.1 ABC transporter ATP-binding protein [Candidatus Poribacteria bacterium]|tara:strand:- start:18 stop:743 length:726 start_codon:yes stop_codon:yes gene_type:complete